MIQKFVSNSHWNSVCFRVTLFNLSVKYVGDKLLDQRINIKYLVELEKNATDTVFTTCYGKFMNRKVSRIHAFGRQSDFKMEERTLR
jgi:hypothetical protein